MGRIEKALRKAAARREQATPSVKSAAMTNHPTRMSVDELDFASFRRVELDSEYLAAHRIISMNEKSVASESFKMLRTRVKHSMDSQNLTTLAISSAAPHDGKSLIATNLAFRMAVDKDMEVILVDMDLRHPSISELLNIDPGLPGLRDYLEGDLTLQDICICPGPERLAILPNTHVFENSSEIMSSVEMSELVSKLRGNNPARKVVFDLPPLLSADDFLAFSRHVDALLLVVSEGKTPRSDLIEVFEHIGDINVIGTVLNQSVGRNDVYYG